LRPLLREADLERAPARADPPRREDAAFLPPEDFRAPPFFAPPFRPPDALRAAGRDVPRFRAGDVFFAPDFRPPEEPRDALDVLPPLFLEPSLDAFPRDPLPRDDPPDSVRLPPEDAPLLVPVDAEVPDTKVLRPSDVEELPPAPPIEPPPEDEPLPNAEPAPEVAPPAAPPLVLPPKPPPVRVDSCFFPDPFGRPLRPRGAPPPNRSSSSSSSSPSSPSATTVASESTSSSSSASSALSQSRSL
jgi:hypothetical protein